MKKLLYASKGWKKLQKEYIDENCFAQRSQKLAAVSQQDVTGFSYEEMIIHYGFIWSSALNCGIDQYVQTGSFANMEDYFCLASKARQIAQDYRAEIDGASSCGRNEVTLGLNLAMADSLVWDSFYQFLLEENYECC